MARSYSNAFYGMVVFVSRHVTVRLVWEKHLLIVHYNCASTHIGLQIDFRYIVPKFLMDYFTIRCVSYHVTVVVTVINTILSLINSRAAYFVCLPCIGTYSGLCVCVIPFLNQK